MKHLALKSSVSLLHSARWQLASALVVLVGLAGTAIFIHTRPEASYSDDLQKIRGIQTHVNELSYNLTMFIQGHDSFMLDLVKEEGKQISQDLNGLMESLSRTGKKDEAKRLEKAHNGMRETSIALLIADQDLMAAHNALEAGRQGLENELSQAVARKGRKADRARPALERYLRLTRAAGEAQAKKLDTINRFNEWREVLEKALHETPISTGRTPLHPIPFLFQSTLILAGIALAVVTFRQMRGSLVSPIRDILQCVEAAASGDVSRVPDHWSADEVGQLSQAVGRLISVLARSENLVYHLAALVESSGDAIISHTLDGKVLSWNKGAQRIYGYSAEEMKGQSIERLADDSAPHDFKTLLTRIREGERIKTFETFHRARSGRRVRALVRVAAIYDSTRQIIGASFIAQEISDVRTPPAKMAEAAESVERAA